MQEAWIEMGFNSSSMYTWGQRGDVVLRLDEQYGRLGCWLEIKRPILTARFFRFCPKEDIYSRIVALMRVGRCHQIRFLPQKLTNLENWETFLTNSLLITKLWEIIWAVARKESWFESPGTKNPLLVPLCYWSGHNMHKIEAAGVQGPVPLV